MPKKKFFVRNPIALQAAILDCSEAAVHSHPFSKISPENTGSRVLLCHECFLGDLLLGPFRSSCSQSFIFENFIRK